ncbi:glycosyltransferase family 4 protein [Cohnella fermenti]|uniref:Glycosyltransferase family 4 protein n=1 Tax=Cohnella fermenti TaxID=2565925 RepID=A0A4S4BWQ9_9BACL|nr:glycosyltransferase family 4 protein [Cohnella fermenti]THF79053.1 glycosyltransferase family 4 protein [Cohnella fermenti]
MGRKESESGEGLPGTNLIGYVRYEMGIGESCRMAARALERAGVPFGVYPFSGGCTSRSEDSSLEAFYVSEPEYAINLVHVNADQMPVAYGELGPSWFEGRYTIGYWHWELPEFPDEFAEGFRYVDEVWVPSAFVARGVAAKSPVPVVRIPHGVEVRVPPGMSRRTFGLPERRFLFLMMYDTFSYSSRKNPASVIEAYRRAALQFGLPADLVVKMNNPQPEEIAAIRRATEDLPGVHLIDRTLGRLETNALLACADCLVSLHRAEGFGLPIAEAMELGKPVIATAWSGNEDFMSPGNSGAVRYRLQPLGRDFGPYRSEQVWAEPDVEHAAFLMRKVVYDEEWRARISAEGRLTIRTTFSPAASGLAMARRLAQIAGERDARRPGMR